MPKHLALVTSNSQKRNQLPNLLFIEMSRNSILMTIFAHQDDETFSAGGTLAKHVNSIAVSVTKDINRETEFQAACDHLRTKPVALNFQTISTQNQEAIKENLIQILRDYKPTYVITHLEFDYHFEHKLLRTIVEEAIEWASHTTTIGVPGHQVRKLYAAETTVLIPVPEILIDTSKSNAQMVKAIAEYESQSHKGGEGFYAKFHTAKTKLRGIQASTDYAEAFTRVKLVEVGSFKPNNAMEYLD